MSRELYSAKIWFDGVQGGGTWDAEYFNVVDVKDGNYHIQIVQSDGRVVGFHSDEVRRMQLEPQEEKK